MSARIRLFVALLVFVVTIGCCVLPELHWQRYWLRRRGGSVRDGFAPTARLVARWSTRLFALVRLILSVRDRREGPVTRMEGPCIVVANHPGICDPMVVPMVLRELGLDDAGAVVKQEFRDYPVFGRLVADAGYACIDTSPDASRAANEEALRALARRAREDGASVVLFPEGTRFLPEARVPRWRHLLAPKPTGVRILCEELPNYPIVVIAMQWVGLTGGHSLTDLHDYIGRELVIQVRVYDPVPPQDVSAFLAARWTEMDDWISESA